ncbi:hypothetical protein Zmor_001602 [Zophobas morio]|uniref:Uncharacterized protein n=1 Tax=Zophobas morio TaxID=2755281 RepID=A0AA38IZE2_9CUCU|nr:hypothetical protein Zmor_001602 [Zophobas morio]
MWYHKLNSRVQCHMGRGRDIARWDKGNYMDLFVGIFWKGPEDMIFEGSLRRTNLNSYLDVYQQVLNLSNEININTVLETNHEKAGYSGTFMGIKLNSRQELMALLK